jgi:hypothetical protein
VTFSRHAFIYLVLYLAGTPASAAAGTLVTTYGKYPVRGSLWTVIVSADKMDLYNYEEWHVSNPPTETGDSYFQQDVVEKWKASPGWFIFIDNKRRIWAYDGGEKIYVSVVPAGPLEEKSPGAR